MATRTGLTADNLSIVKQQLAYRESGGVYDKVGGAGGNYLGMYQMGAPALETQGYLKPGASKQGNAAVWNPSNWTGKDGVNSAKDFLNNGSAQENAVEGNMRSNYNQLMKNGVLNSDSTQGDIAGSLSASHLIGAGGLKKQGLAGADAFGTSAGDYYGQAKSAVNNGVFEPGKKFALASASKVPGASGAAGAVAGKISNVYKPKDKLDPTGIKDSVEIDTTGGEIAEEKTSLGPITNPLEIYASFNYLFTLSCLSNEAVNFPDTTYRQGNLGSIILSSAGRQPSNRVSTAFATSANPEGKFEFFIDNVRTSMVASPDLPSKGTNACSVDFDIVEPYSMGLFLQACQIAALENSHTDYTQAPFLLTLEFIGYNSSGQVETVPSTTRYFVLQLANIDMQLTTSGSKYSVTATAWGEIALKDNYNILKQNMVISGETVQEMLQSGERSLQYIINSRNQEMAKEAKNEFLPDEVVIVFPILSGSGDTGNAGGSTTNTPAGKTEYAPFGGDEKVTEYAPFGGDTGSRPPISPQAQEMQNVKTAYAEYESANTKEDDTPATKSTSTPTTEAGTAASSKLTLSRPGSLLTQSSETVSELGKSSLSFDLSRGGEFPKVEDNAAYQNGVYQRNLINADVKKREFTFSQGTTVVNAITEVMLMSDYCTKIVSKPPDQKTGMYDWFRIETQTYLQDPIMGNDGNNRTPKLLVYRVVPYKVHMSKFQSPTVQSSGYEYMRLQAAKEYNYLYTGKNVDVLDFQIELKNSMFTTAYADGGRYNGVATQQNRNSQGGSSDKPMGTNNPDGKTFDPGAGARAVGTQVDREKNSDGAGAADSYKTLVAKQFHSALLSANNVDMMEGQLTIMGDPYFISDSGVGNWSDSGMSARSSVTPSGAIDYQQGEVDILINFRSPIDIGLNGIMEFGQDSLNAPFSGLYQVTNIDTTFNKGKFTHVLKLLRRPNQNPLPQSVIAEASSDPTTREEQVDQETGQGAGKEDDSKATQTQKDFKGNLVVSVGNDEGKSEPVVTDVPEKATEGTDVGESVAGWL